MTRRGRYLFIMVSSLLALNIISSADAFIRRDYTLEEVVSVCSGVMFGKVASIDPKGMCFTVHQIENTKGDGQFRQIKISLTIGQDDSTRQLMGKISDGAPFVIFYVPMGTNRIEALGYISDVWVRLFATRDSSRDFRWYFAYIEKYMKRAFKGDALKLESLVRDILSGEKRQGSANITGSTQPGYTLEKVVQACSTVMFGEVASLDQEKMRFIIHHVENIKGKEQLKQIKVNLTLGRGDSPKQIMSKLRPGVPVVLFYAPVAAKRIEALGYIADTWVRLFAVQALEKLEQNDSNLSPPNTRQALEKLDQKNSDLASSNMKNDGSKILEWYLAHMEENMESVYSGDALRLQSLVRDMIAEKKTARLETKYGEKRDEL